MANTLKHFHRGFIGSLPIEMDWVGNDPSNCWVCVGLCQKKKKKGINWRGESVKQEEQDTSWTLGMVGGVVEGLSLIVLSLIKS